MSRRRPIAPAEFTGARPLPRADHVPQPEEFAAWCEHPVTRYVAAAHAAAAELQRHQWLKMSWSAEPLNEVARAELRARADAYRAFYETDLQHYMKIMELLDGKAD